MNSIESQIQIFQFQHFIQKDCFMLFSIAQYSFYAPSYIIHIMRKPKPYFNNAPKFRESFLSTTKSRIPLNLVQYLHPPTAMAFIQIELPILNTICISFGQQKRPLEIHSNSETISLYAINLRTNNETKTDKGSTITQPQASAELVAGCIVQA